jgi:hypothetical protein
VRKPKHLHEAKLTKGALPSTRSAVLARIKEIKHAHRPAQAADEVCGWWKRDGLTVKPAFWQPGTENGGHTPI